MLQSKEINQTNQTVLVLGANSDVAKEAIMLYIKHGHRVIAASRSTDELLKFQQQQGFSTENFIIQFFDAAAFDTHQQFYNNLPCQMLIYY